MTRFKELKKLHESKNIIYAIRIHSNFPKVNTMPEDNHLDVKENKKINSSQALKYEPRPHKSFLEEDNFGVRYRPTSHPHQNLNPYLTLVDNTL